MNCRALVLLLLSLAPTRALVVDPAAAGSVHPLKLPGGGSVPVAGKPARQNSIDFGSRTNSPDLKAQVAELGADMPGKAGGAAAANAAVASKGYLVSLALVGTTAASFYQVKYASGPGGGGGVTRDGNYLKGLAIACLALVGNAMVGAFRKILSQHNIGSAQQVGFAALIQGVFSIAFCFHSGDLKLGSPREMADALPPKAFWCASTGTHALKERNPGRAPDRESEREKRVCAKTHTHTHTHTHTIQVCGDRGVSAQLGGEDAGDQGHLKIEFERQSLSVCHVLISGIFCCHRRLPSRTCHSVRRSSRSIP